MGGEDDAILFLGRDDQAHDLRIMSNLMFQVGRLEGDMPQPRDRNQSPLLFARTGRSIASKALAGAAIPFRFPRIGSTFRGARLNVLLISTSLTRSCMNSFCSWLPKTLRMRSSAHRISLEQELSSFTPAGVTKACLVRRLFFGVTRWTKLRSSRN